MQHLEVSGAVRPLKWPLDVKWLNLISFIGITFACRRQQNTDLARVDPRSRRP